MKTIALTFLFCSSLLFAQEAPQAAKNEFSMLIEGVNCVVKAYQPVKPIIFSPLVNKDELPKAQMITSIMIGKSDITSYLTDDDLSKYALSESLTEDQKKEQLEKIRASMKKMYSLTSPDAEDNPWKGLKYSIDQVFVIDSALGKFLVHQLSPRESKDDNEKLFGTRTFSNGIWILDGNQEENIEKFNISMMKLIPKEFEKLQKESAVAALPLEDLLK